MLEGTLQETGFQSIIHGNTLEIKSLTILEDEEITITIDPNGNKMGSVSVDILQKIFKFICHLFLASHERLIIKIMNQKFLPLIQIHL